MCRIGIGMATLATHRSDLDSGWFGPTANAKLLLSVGFKMAGGGPHQSKTMMLAEFSALLAHCATTDVVDDILHQNLLGKPSMRSRQAALYRLEQLYGVRKRPPISAVLFKLWDRDP